MKAPVRFVFLFAALCVLTTVTLKIPESTGKDHLKNLSHLEPKEAHLETTVETFADAKAIKDAIVDTANTSDIMTKDAEAKSEEEPPALPTSIESVKQVAELEAKLNRSDSKVQTLTSENAKLVKSNLKLQKQKAKIQSRLNRQKAKYQKLEAKHRQEGQAMQSQKPAKTMGRRVLAVGRSRHRRLRRGRQPKNGAVMPLVLLSSKSGTSFDVVEQGVEHVHGITIGGPGVKVCTGSCDCPTGDICDIKCADGKCSLAQFTGVFRNMFCGKGACKTMPLVVKVTGSATCKGELACFQAKGFEVGGNFDCDGKQACKGLQEVTKVTGSATCKGYYACHYAKGFEVGGNFDCDGKRACERVKEVTKVTGSATCKGEQACFNAKGFEVGGNFDCDGTRACSTLKEVTKVTGSATCKGYYACSYAKGFEVGGNFDCDGTRACSTLKEVTKAYSVSATNGAIFPPKLEVFRNAGQIQAWNTTGMTKPDITVYNKAAKKGEFRGQMEDYGFGYQALAIAARDQEGAGLEAGPATISGTVTVEPGWQFYLQEGARPTGNSSFLVPAVSKSQKTLQFTTLNISDDGHAFIDNPGMARAAILSLSSVFYPVDPSNKTNGHFTSQTYEMGNGAFVCTLSGMQLLSVGAGADITLLKLDPKCTRGYTKAGFQVAAQVFYTNGTLLLNVERPEHQITLTEDNELVLSVSSSATESKVTLSLDGLVFASADSEKPLPEACYPPSQSVSLGSIPCFSKSLNVDAARAACPIFGEGLTADDAQGNYEAVHDSICTESPVVANKATEKGAQAPLQLLCGHMAAVCPRLNSTPTGCANNLCNYECKPDVQVNTNATVKGTTERLFPQDSVVGPSHLVIMGKSIAERTCALRGVVKFTKVGDASNATWIAQIDPNLRDPTLRTPLCLPMATMIFHAGVVAGEAAKEIESLVAIQIEPHGRIRVISETGSMSGSTTLYLRLDGITYRPILKFLTTPNECVPYCFDESNTVPSTSLMSGTSCIKYCTPSEIDPKTMKSIECKCDLVKRIECWARGKTTNIRCGQFKKLMGMRMTGMNNMKHVNAKCALTCARQLAIL